MNAAAQSIIAYCRAGYEVDTGNELTAIATARELYGYPAFKPGDGFVRFQFYEPDHAAQFISQVAVHDTIFPRQLFLVLETIQIEDKSDRIGPILDALADAATGRSGLLFVDYPDTDEGKTLAKLCRKFAVPLRQALRARDLLSKKEHTGLPALHVFFTSGEQCYLGVSQAKQRSPFENGICRLKFPPKAPSRSTLKLEEALLTMLSAAQRDAICRPGARAVDLGACPGGWTYQLVSRDMHVEAVDNGKMADDLMATGLVDYRAEDGFKYRPQMGHVELLVCDMIEKPDRVAVLMANWLTRNWATHAIFNLKLPMKRRYETVTAAIETVRAQLNAANIKASMVIRHLYHNRDEVTVAVIREK
ncbi:23S rRNA (cytidine(2498)-2'-O)-methyltransferase RlmM [Alteromonas lipolytica]|uniref:Ribosomal RNA large subunit methyltransferase M n=1 Tax=Alteromonas lipolytica TaxID=1856405 RepID=A0A1E8FFG2_9ALTE|nr:23S rRNA (cytidine(2498)-2'-O)-methyltransferase RlmM [Alteromonas lipolytica]OFI34697.1 23S rRNA (cytidine(2498)-2'-O)-methyltransferase RlmM [Alteromonas lipolytica]GGF53251.1 ribosomal RNA large subunit methyltransferase M [Alteromonas lipolytica]